MVLMEYQGNDKSEVLVNSRGINRYLRGEGTPYVLG